MPLLNHQMKRKNPQMKKRMDLVQRKKKLMRTQLPVCYIQNIVFSSIVIILEAKAMAEKAMSDPMAMAGNLKFW